MHHATATLHVFTTIVHYYTLSFAQMGFEQDDDFTVCFYLFPSYIYSYRILYKCHKQLENNTFLTCIFLDSVILLLIKNKLTFSGLTIGLLHSKTPFLSVTY